MTGLVSTVLAVFSEVSTWMMGALQDVIDLFYTNGEMTFFGLLAIIPLAISVVLLLFGIVRSYLHFRA